MTEEEDAQLENYVRKIAREESARGGGGADVTLGEFGKFATAAKAMKEAMTSDVDKALSSAVSTKIVDQVIPSMSPQPRASAGFWDSNAGVALMNKIGDQISPLADLVFNKIGNERTGRLVDGFTNTYLSGGKSDDNNISLSLDPDNPADMHKYMALRNISDPNVARKMLIEEKQSSLQRVKSGDFGGVSGGNGGVGTDITQALESQNAMLREMLEARKEDRAALVQMWQSMEQLKKEQVNIKTGIVNRVNDGFNIDTIKDRGNDVVEKNVEKNVVKVEEVKAESVDVEVKEVKIESVDIDVEEVKVEKKVVKVDNVESVDVEVKEQECLDSEGVKENEKIGDEEKTENAIVNIRKGTPKWKGS